MKLSFRAQCLGCGSIIEKGEDAIVFETLYPFSFNSISFRHIQCQKLESIFDLHSLDEIMRETMTKGLNTDGCIW